MGRSDERFRQLPDLGSRQLSLRECSHGFVNMGIGEPGAPGADPGLGVDQVGEGLVLPYRWEPFDLAQDEGFDAFRTVELGLPALTSSAAARRARAA